MSFMIKYIVNIIVGIRRRSWYFFKLDKLNKDLEQKKKEVKDAEIKTRNAVDDFEHSLRVFNKSKKKD